MIIQIVAADENNAIGKNNQLLCHLPADLKHFKAITSGYPVIMGRKTYESIGKPLVNRRNIVITRQNIHIAGCEIVHSVTEALNLCQNEEKAFIIGGADIYRQSLPITNIIYLTRIHHQFDADTYFPEIKKEEWHQKTIQHYPSDTKNHFPYSFNT